MDTLRVLLACFFVVFLYFSEMRASENENALAKSSDHSNFSIGFTYSELNNYSQSDFRYLNFNDMILTDNDKLLHSNKGKGISFGLALDYGFSNPQMSNISISSRVQYSKNEQNFSNLVQSLPFKDATTGQVLYSNVYVSSKIQIEAFTVDFLLKYDIPGTKLGITIGPQICNVISSSHSSIYYLDFDSNSPLQFTLETEPGSLLLKLDPTNPIYELNGYHPRYVDDTRTAIRLYEGELEYRNNTRLGLLLGMQVEVDLQWFSLVPFIQYNMGITPVVNVDRWNLNALQLGVDCRFYL